MAAGNAEEQQHLDENHAYDGSGMAPRKCTDLPCLVLFLVYLAGMGYITKFAYDNGNPRRLTHGFNFQGDLCGVDAAVLGRPILYWCGAGGVQENGHPVKLDLQFPTCVSKCPTDFSMPMACLGEEKVQIETSGEEPYTTQKTIITRSTVKQMSYPTREFGGGYCVPHFLKEKILGNDILTKQLTGPEGPIGSTFFRLSEAFGSLSRTWMLFTMVIPFAAVLSYLFLFLLKIAARPTVVVSLTLIVTSLAAVGCFFLAGEVLQGDQLASWREHNVLYKQTSEGVADRTSKAIGTWCILLACVGACALVALRDAINVAVGCVQAACECIFSMPSLVIAPAIEAVCKLTVIVSLLGGLAMLISTAEMRPDTMTVQGEVVGGLTRHLEFNDERKLMLAYYVMGMLWLAELSSSLSQFVISYSVILWYYHPKPKGFGPTAPLVRGFIVALFYHLGSLALGAFMLALLRSVRIIMMWISRQAKNDGSMVCFALASCCTCCITFAQRYLEFLNKNAYIDIALSSSNYCTAAQNALGFISSAGGKVLVLNGACFVVCIAVVLGVGTCTTGMTWLLVTTNSRYTSDRSLHHVENPYFVSAIAGFIGASVALCFMVIFDHVSDTLVYVFVWNRSHGHNTVAKYCPDVLLNLLEYKKLEETQKQAPKEEGGIFSSFFGANQEASRAEREGLMQR